jgi:hypothetical protein
MKGNKENVALITLAICQKNFMTKHQKKKKYFEDWRKQKWSHSEFSAFGALGFRCLAFSAFGVLGIWYSRHPRQLFELNKRTSEHKCGHHM